MWTSSLVRRLPKKYCIYRWRGKPHLREATAGTLDLRKGGDPGRGLPVRKREACTEEQCPTAVLLDPGRSRERHISLSSAHTPAIWAEWSYMALRAHPLAG
ncbi:hypothetical protein NDU88_006268 [Pleurodeles waltl]|uniref:Uncharacterized protein n=1 Tax=Pleurodeles waltl TaxID=8319 RepID=A0AAV7WD39_PLEWA|nr:hypothetical protein NDU88_006268 [Pleurodeles waltl]